MKEDGEEKKKKSWRGRGRSNEWMTDATDRSPLTEQTRRGNCHVCQVAQVPPDAALSFSRLLPLDLCPVNLSGFIHRAKQEESRYLSAHPPLGSFRSANKSFPSRHSSGYYYCLGASLENVLPNYSEEMNITIIYYVRCVERFRGLEG
jgi:hypothetical protein